MPPKRQAQAAGKRGTAPKTSAGPRGMAKSISPGVQMTDLMKKQWVLGPVIGQGGFGYIYLGDKYSGSPVTASNANYVIKVEPHANGPLFVELAFYQRVAKDEMIRTWTKTNKKKHLGIPVYIGTGSFEHDGMKYRFMVMDRFGTDIEKIYKQNDFVFPEKTVYSLGLRILDTLEYIHEKEYVHADIKSSNLMLGFKKADQTKMFLLDYGLAYRYCPNGKHVNYKEDPKRKHDGTIEYTSRDAHKGLAPARRGDLEILAYCMIQWLCKRLPWEDKLTDKDYVMRQKIKYMDDIPDFMKTCFGKNKPVPLEKYLNLINEMDYEDTPDYTKIRSLFADGLKKVGVKDDGESVYLPSSSAPRVGKRASSAVESQEKRLRSEDAAGAAHGGRQAARASPKDSPRKAPPEMGAKLPKIPGLVNKRSPPTKSLLAAKAKVKIVRAVKADNAKENGDRVVHIRPRRRNVPTKDFGQSP